MRFLILIPLLVASIVEYVNQGRFGIAMVSGLYMFLSIQAEHSAKRFLRYGLQPASPLLFGFLSESKASIPPKPPGWDSCEEPLKVKPLHQKKAESFYEQAPHREAEQKIPPRAEKKPQFETHANAQAQAQVKPGPRVKPVPRVKPAATAKLPEAPIFNGKPHEVLAVQENAATQTIVRAFRHWVKKYHPDHAHSPAETQSANEHTRMLTTAKEKLLYRRKQMRKSKTA
jgi:hypothetical protein